MLVLTLLRWWVGPGTSGARDTLSLRGRFGPCPTVFQFPRKLNAYEIGRTLPTSEVGGGTCISG